ncbi:MAG: hypothetical protein SVW57_10515 [Thermodesulfobacteriota bacterium]|nr:hypothetical protein [Thermodesulfobacteriota bacterium]
MLIETKRQIDRQVPHELVRLCSYCGQIYGLKPTSLGTIGISHGICESCKPAANAELEAAFAEWKGDNHG